MQAEETNEQEKAPTVKVDETLDTVVERINDAESILVTLSKDPTVDEMAAALGLTLMLDGYGKHVTAIYSGKTPNALGFLKPGETFEANTNSLQDFIIALNKEKADHLRYKIEGDFVKVYITPYKTTISESDLEFSRGEVNVDLVIAIDVVETEDLDAALSQHGRIMHNASLINVSSEAPGRLGGLEWSNPHASSVSEMIVTLVEKLGQTMTKEVATALLTGIVAATERFSNNRTTPDAMTLASKLMQLGADQQLIVAQIMNAKQDEVKTSAEESTDSAEKESMEAQASAEPQLSPEQQLEQMIRGDSGNNTGGMNDVMKELEAAVPTMAEPKVVAPVAEMPAAVPVTEAPKKEEIPTLSVPEVSEFATPALPVEPQNNNTNVAAIPQSKVQAETVYGVDGDRTKMEEKVMAPLNEEVPKDYSAMIDEALNEQMTPVMNPMPAESPIATGNPVMVNNAVAVENPAMAAAPEVPVVEQQMMGGVDLPPPPTPDASTVMPPVPSLPEVQPMQVAATMPEAPTMPEMPNTPAQDESAAQLTVTAPSGVQVQPEPINPVVVQPEQSAASTSPVQDPSAFKIPGM